MTPAPFLAPNARRKAFPLSFFLSPHVNANCKPPPSLQARVGGASSYFCCWRLSRVSLVGVFLQRKTEGGFLFSLSPILASNARWWGFCAGVSVPPLHRPPQVGGGGYPSCRELFGSLVQCHLLTHPKREWQVFLSVALNAHKLVPSPQNVSGGVLFPESCIR